MRIKRLLAAFILLAAWLSGCSNPDAVSNATLPPTEMVPTWIAETVAARAAAEGTASAGLLVVPEQAEAPSATPAAANDTPEATATLSSLGPSPTPTLTFTPTNTQPPSQPTRTPTPVPTAAIPSAAIQIRSPGPLSRIISPLQLQASVKPGLDGRVRVELLGEDGRLLVRKIINYGERKGYVLVSEDLEFEISAAAETARLVISTYDTFSRLYALQAVDVILLSIGQDDVNPSGTDQEAVIVLEPLPNKLIQGGMLLVSGLSRLPGDAPLLIELVTSQGKVVGYRQAGVTNDPEGEYTTFSAEVPYRVEETTWVRMVIRQENGGRIPGVMYATSFEVLLSP
jgi:hypothetical protein